MIGLLGGGEPMAGQSGGEVAVSTSAVGLGTLPDCDYLLIQCQDAQVRVRSDGTNPTASVGFLWTVNASYLVPLEEAKALKAIRAGGSDGALFWQPFTYPTRA